LLALLDEMRAADAVLWFLEAGLLADDEWLPKEEAAQFCLEFETELARLLAA
jgi:hypothetical protein